MTGDLADEQYCYLTTTGRVTGRSHEIEIWYALDGGTIYMLSDNHGSDWVRNLRRTPEVTVRITGETSTAAPASSRTEGRTSWRGGSSWRSTSPVMAASRTGDGRLCP
jgi:deazaflavin-dependent oxidoreductase (nitroreductase family)